MFLKYRYDDAHVCVGTGSLCQIAKLAAIRDLNFYEVLSNLVNGNLSLRILVI